MPDTTPLPLAEALDLIAFRCRECLDQTDHDSGRALYEPGAETYYALRNALHDILSVVSETLKPPF